MNRFENEKNSSLTENMMPLPSVFTIILNYNNYSDTKKTIESVLSLDYDANSVLLVENSTDPVVNRKMRSQFPALEILENEKNLGYAGGNNKGIQEAIARCADYIFLLNNDVILENDVLRKCVNAMEMSHDCAACQPQIAFLKNPDKTWSAGTQLFFGYPRLFLKGTKLQRDGIKKSPYGLVGCAILFRTSAIERIGLLDESFYLLQEETDWCIRAKKMGYSLNIVSDAVVYHKISATIGLFSKIYLYYVGRNWLLVGKKNFHPVYYVYILATELFLRFPYYLLQLAKAGQIQLAKYYLKGIKDGIFGISGEAKISAIS
jgi:GT2 family glycosyltransferase